MSQLTTFESAHAGHPANQSLTVQVVVGEAIGPHIDAIARLRMAVLREWPHLCTPSPTRVVQQLGAYPASWRSVAVLVFDAETMVGASLGLPLGEAPAVYQQPLAGAGLAPQQVFHYGGSVLLPRYRGRGLGHRFFDERESHARMLGDFTSIVFWAVDRPLDHPRRPPFGRGSESFWQRRGYRPREDLVISLDWDEDGAGGQAHACMAWLRPLERVR